MTCNCNKETKEMECPEGQTYDVSQGKCVAKSENDKDKSKEQFGDPAVSQKADLADSDVDTGDVQKVENQECPPGHSFDATTETCMPTAPEVPEIADTNADISKEKIQKLESDIAELKMREKKPTAQVGTENSVKTFGEVANEYPKALEAYGTYKFTIPHDVLRGIQVGRADAKTGVREAFRNGTNEIIQPEQEDL